MHTCSLFGHRDMWGEDDFDEKLEGAICYAIENLGISEFWVGGYGKFDFFASLTLKENEKEIFSYSCDFGSCIFG